MNLGEWDNGEHLGLTGGGDTILECTVWKKNLFSMIKETTKPDFRDPFSL